MTTKILIIDDDERLNDLLTKYLLRHNIEARSATTPEGGLAELRRSSPDLIILDIMLPGKSGFDVCRDIRQISAIPIIMLTARHDVTDRIVGLKLGADDYVLKPVDPAELAARIETVLRRSKASPVPSQRIMNFRGLEVDLNRRTTQLDHIEIKLSTMEFAVLELFVCNPGRVLSRDELLDNLRGIEWETINRSVDVLVSRLRQKLNDDVKNPRFLKTVRGSGYLFIGTPEEYQKAS